MSHKHLFSLGGHSVTSDIGGGDIVKEIPKFISLEICECTSSYYVSNHSWQIL